MPTAEKTRALTQPTLENREVPSDDPIVEKWLNVLYTRLPHFSHTFPITGGRRVGTYVGDRLYAVIGYSQTYDDTYFVDFVACDPSRRGAVLLRMLLLSLFKSVSGATIRFCTEVSNAKIRHLARELFGAKAVGVLYEVRT